MTTATTATPSRTRSEPHGLTEWANWLTSVGGDASVFYQPEHGYRDANTGVWHGNAYCSRLSSEQKHPGRWYPSDGISNQLCSCTHRE
jgi:hypothetical protein